MAVQSRFPGSAQASGLANSYTDQDGAYMDYDAAGGYVQFGAKKSAGGSVGLKLRTILAGVATTVLTFTAAGAATFVGAVTGGAANFSTITGSGLLNVTASGQAVSLSGAGTASQYIQAQNTGGNLIVGIERSTGGSIITGTAGYGAVISTMNTTALYFGTNAGIAISIDGTTRGASFVATMTVTTGQVLQGSGAGTGRQYIDFTNTGGQLQLGVDSSVGGAMFTGSAAYSSSFGTVGAKSLHLATNNTVRTTWDSNGSISHSVSVASVAAAFVNTDGTNGFGVKIRGGEGASKYFLTLNKSDDTFTYAQFAAGTVLIDHPSAQVFVAFQQNATAKAYVGVANAANDLVSGSSSNDMVIRSQGGSMRFSVDSGASSALTITKTIGTASQGNLYISDSTAPTGNPSGGGYMYSSAGAGKWRGSSGTITTFGPAEPHCPVCGSDFGHEWHNKKYGGTLRVCMKCLVADVAPNKPYIVWRKAA